MAETTAYDFTLSQLDANLTVECSRLVDELNEGEITQSTFEAQNETLHTARDFIKEQYRRATCLCTDINFEVQCQDETIGIKHP